METAAVSRLCRPSRHTGILAIRWVRVTNNHLANWAINRYASSEQVEDEISVSDDLWCELRGKVCVTSGGGFDPWLKLSLSAGMIETPSRSSSLSVLALPLVSQPERTRRSHPRFIADTENMRKAVLPRCRHSWSTEDFTVLGEPPIRRNLSNPESSLTDKPRRNKTQPWIQHRSSASTSNAVSPLIQPNSRANLATVSQSSTLPRYNSQVLTSILLRMVILTRPDGDTAWRRSRRRWSTKEYEKWKPSLLFTRTTILPLKVLMQNHPGFGSTKMEVMDSSAIKSTISTTLTSDHSRRRPSKSSRNEETKSSWSNTIWQTIFRSAQRGTGVRIDEEWKKYDGRRFYLYGRNGGENYESCITEK